MIGYLGEIGALHAEQRPLSASQLMIGMFSSAEIVYLDDFLYFVKMH